MSDSGSDQRNDPRKDQLVDRLLGELSDQEAAALRRELDADPTLALEAAELRCLFDELRSLTVPSSERVGFMLRNAVERRVRLRHPERLRPRRGPMGYLLDGLQVAAAAALVLGGAMLGERFVWGGDADADADIAAAEFRLREPGAAEVAAPGSLGGSPGPEYVATFRPQPHYLRDDRPRDPSDRAAKPYRIFSRPCWHGRQPCDICDKRNIDQRFVPSYGRFERARPDDVWLCATNTLASLRHEFRYRFSPHLRRQVIRAAGGSVFLASRIESLAEEVAAKVDAALDGDGEPTVQDVALSLRALMAGGSTRRVGEHHRTVRRCAEWLLGRLPALHGGELATALSGLVDLAVVSGPKFGRSIGEHASRLAESIIYSNNDHRPSMLNWQSTAAQLADAGQVLRLAPALGMVNKEALLAREYLSVHLAEQIAWSTAERPDLLAAQLYGFGDLVDAAELDHKLSLWRPRDLVPEYFVALHHLAWSRFPIRAGWADFQYELRSVSAHETPDGCADAAALLLTLAVSYAAPGSGELMELALR